MKSKFYRRYYAKFLNIESDIEKDEAEIEEITNQYYAPEFAEYFAVEFMTYIPICGALMLDLVVPSISRVSNAFVESFNKVLKHSVLEHQTRNPIGMTIRKLKDNVQLLMEEANLGIGAHTKSTIKARKKALYPDTASNPFVKDIWRRGNKGTKRRESCMKAKEIQRVVKKLTKQNTENEQEFNQAEVKALKSRLPKTRKKNS